jgi:hypothetical protein
MPKEAKIKPEEYTDPEVVDPLTDPAAEGEAKTDAEQPEGDKTEAEDTEPEAKSSLERVTAQPTGEPEGDEWKLGRPAPATMYFDIDSGEVTETQPVRANIIVLKGHQVTPHILRQIKGV